VGWEVGQRGRDIDVKRQVGKRIGRSMTEWQTERKRKWQMESQTQEGREGQNGGCDEKQAGRGPKIWRQSRGKRSSRQWGGGVEDRPSKVGKESQGKGEKK
jgi:hypothetical protein